MEIYFDNSATTKVMPQAAKRAYEVMTEDCGNPSSVHGMGVKAQNILASARETVLSSLGVRPRGNYTLFFTGSGTEADNMAVNGVLYAKSFRFRPRIITTNSEHPAVLSPLTEAEKKGFEVVYLSTKNGKLDLDELKNALTPEAVLLSIMRVNNETGAVYDVKGAFSLAKELCPDIITHCDAIQGYMKLKCDPAKLGADLISISAHKIGAPKGVGALICNNALITSKRISPIVFGGGQENGYRSGTENMPGIAAFSEAVRLRSKTFNEDCERVSALRERLISALPEDVTVNTASGEYLPHIISLSAKGIKSEVLVRALSSEGIYISAGSACSSKKLKTSTVLTAFGLTPDIADSTVRVSLCPENTEEECDIFVQKLREALGRLARKH